MRLHILRYSGRAFPVLFKADIGQEPGIDLGISFKYLRQTDIRKPVHRQIHHGPIYSITFLHTHTKQKSEKTDKP